MLRVEAMSFPVCRQKKKRSSPLRFSKRPAQHCSCRVSSSLRSPQASAKAPRKEGVHLKIYIVEFSIACVRTRLHCHDGRTFFPCGGDRVHPLQMCFYPSMSCFCSFSPLNPSSCPSLFSFYKYKKLIQICFGEHGRHRKSQYKYTLEGLRGSTTKPSLCTIVLTSQSLSGVGFP